MKDYLEAAIRQHVHRGEHLVGKIPKPTQLPQEFHLLLQTSNRELEATLHNLEALLKEPKMLLAEYQPERLRRYRRAVQQMSLIESTCVAALTRHDDDDQFLSRLVKQIAQEISYPLLAPAVTSLSQDYFHIYPPFNLLFVPLGEGSFLLHLPDLYHELAHPLLTVRYNPHVKPLQAALWNVLSTAYDYIAKEKQKERRGRGPRTASLYLDLWERSWLDWAVEFVCDLFAIYTLGPAFAWSHLHLCAKHNEPPFRVPLFSASTHPADHARMRVMLYGLHTIDFDREADLIGNRWEQLLIISGAEAEAEYDRCFPEALLEVIAVRTYEGIFDSGLQVASPKTDLPVYNILNQAWNVFWEQPEKFTSWEQRSVDELQKLINGQPFGHPYIAAATQHT